MFKLYLEKAEEPAVKLPTSAGSWKKQESSRKNIYFCFIDYAKASDSVNHHKLWKILKKIGVPDHLSCLLSNLYAGQEATVRTGHGTTDWFQIRKGVRWGCILSSCLFNTVYMPTSCWLKHLCSIRALVPVSFFLSLSLPPSSSLFHFLIIDSRPPGSGPLKDPNK